jgi:hypothetical protein
MEFDYYSKTEFGYRAMYMIQEAPPIQMILRLAQLLFWRRVALVALAFWAYEPSPEYPFLSLLSILFLDQRTFQTGIFTTIFA